MLFKDKILNFYNLKDKKIIDEVYPLKKNRYLAFLDVIVTHKNIESFLQSLADSVKVKKCKTVIVVSETNEVFSKTDLLYFNGVDTIVVFVLINNQNMEIYYTANWIYMLGLNYKKYVKQIVEIIQT